jgi:hypothetical protein
MAIRFECLRDTAPSIAGHAQHPAQQLLARTMELVRFPANANDDPYRSDEERRALDDVGPAWAQGAADERADHPQTASDDDARQGRS